MYTICYISLDISNSRSTTYACGLCNSSNCKLLDEILRYGTVIGTAFDQEPKFDEPNFTENIPVHIEDDDYVVMTVNIFLVLNTLLAHVQPSEDTPCNCTEPPIQQDDWMDQSVF